MNEQITIKRTNSNDVGFQQLIAALDNELWNELNEDQAKYDQYNKVPDLKTVLILYVNEKPAASGCIKKYNENTVEVKRMFVVKEHRGKGLSSMILKELESWAIELGFHYAILETSIHFKAARSLYTNAGYKIIDNYDQYAGLEESICMRKELVKEEPSEFCKLAGIEYFDFEEDFIEENVRCIPMIVRFKMDAAGIKLKLSEWSKFKREERIELALKPCGNAEESGMYNQYLASLIKKYTNSDATVLEGNNKPAWANLQEIPELLQQKANEFNWQITKEQWSGLTNLQRFALTRLYRPGHENKNFPKAMKEFGLVQVENKIAVN
jgi:hypothetical protein